MTRVGPEASWFLFESLVFDPSTRKTWQEFWESRSKILWDTFSFGQNGV